MTDKHSGGGALSSFMQAALFMSTQSLVRTVSSLDLNASPTEIQIFITSELSSEPKKEVDGFDSPATGFTLRSNSD